MWHRISLIDQPFPAAVADHGILALEAHRAADRGAHYHPGPQWIGDLYPAVVECFAGAGHRELSRPVQAASVLLAQPLGDRIEVALARDTGPEGRRVERRDRPGRRASRSQ